MPINHSIQERYQHKNYLTDMKNEFCTDTHDYKNLDKNYSFNIGDPVKKQRNEETIRG